jgi:hypothetical protein
MPVKGNNPYASEKVVICKLLEMGSCSAALFSCLRLMKTRLRHCSVAAFLCEPMCESRPWKSVFLACSSRKRVTAVTLWSVPVPIERTKLSMQLV